MVTMRNWFCALVGIGVVACGTVEPVDPQTPSLTCGETFETAFDADIPVAPVSEKPLILAVPFAEARETMSVEMQLGLGPGLPCVVTRTVFLNIGPCIGESLGAFTLGSPTVDTAGLDATSSERTLRLEARQAGTYQVELPIEVTDVFPTRCSSGEEPGGMVTASISVAVVEPSQVGLRRPVRCQDETMLLVEDGQTLDGFRLVAADESGRTLLFSNAETEASVPIRLTPSRISWSASGPHLSDVRLIGEGRLGIESYLGPSFEIETYSASDLDGVNLSFQLPGVAGSPRELEDGARYEGFGRQGDHIVVGVEGFSRGGVDVCTSHSLDSTFSLRSLTPDTCAVVNPLPFEPNAYVVDGDVLLPLGARVLRDGLCVLEVESPVSTQRFEATLLGTANLFPLGN